MDSVLKKLTSNDTQHISAALEELTHQISEKFDFPELNEHEYRANLWKALYNILKDENCKLLHKSCLHIIRIISREKKELDKLVTKDYLDLILFHAALKENKDITESINYEVALEALMCLCNIIYNATIPRMFCCKKGTLENILQRLHNREIPSNIKYFDMKILFIITALCTDIRATIKDELHGITYLTEYLELILKELLENDNEAGVTDKLKKLLDIDTNLSIEILKTLFNLTVCSKFQNLIDEEEENHYMRLVGALRDLLLIETEESEKKIELDGHVIHLLLNMPDQCLKSLVTTIETDQKIPTNRKYEQNNMAAIYEILIYLKSRFDPEPGVSNQNEILSPVLSAMIKLAKSDRIMRKYLRTQVLPPLRDTHTRPEQGTAIRNCLCRLLTSPVTQVRDLAADFLFILCKENIGRMIKYTGYGNAAGMFASRGLLNGQNGETENYSSASEDSETEEYNEFKHGINPVTGCYQEPKPHPTAHMTEEQKEYEAMKLVDLMHNLTKQGVVKPCRIGADGRPEPIQHVLQLQEDLPNQQIHLNDED